MSTHDPFIEDHGVYVPERRPRHRDDEYDEMGFNVLIQMQRDHFWYRGRHKLLLNVLKKEVPNHFAKTCDLRAIDMGGGCGGWLEYLHDRQPSMFQQLALGDSSIRALTLAEPFVRNIAERYQVDLLDIVWSEEWDVVFLLDVLEHIPDHGEALRQIRKCMRPGGLLFVTTPALNFFWSYNDELAHHQRRYCKRDFQDMARNADLKLLRADYFMFFLSPALLLSRLLSRTSTSASLDQRREYLERTHRIPVQPVNRILTGIFSIEALMVNRVGFPWGTSILALLQR
jgi:trans-aconitate methyltransferase